MEPGKTPQARLFLYRLSVWVWALLWPTTFVFTFWQIFMAGHLALWESILLVMILGLEAKNVFIIGYELIHRRTTWERFMGELLLASVSYPHYATEHFYIHHAHVGTPKDMGSAPEGQSVWSYLPRELASNLLGAWKVECKRMGLRQLPAWHINNPLWRYGLATATWYMVAYLIGGWWAVLIFVLLSAGAVIPMKVRNYFQHYGLHRVRLPNGRFEKVHTWHSWSIDYQFSNWMLFNVQRQPDHHVAVERGYALLQYHPADQCPRLPRRYGMMFGLSLCSKRFFETMDPLVDQWRARFHPEIGDWSAYDSPVSKLRPDAFEDIVEIFEVAPRLARAIEQDPTLLDNLQHWEFTGLIFPGESSPVRNSKKPAVAAWCASIGRTNSG